MKLVVNETLWLDELRDYEKSIRQKTVKELCNLGHISRMRYDLRNLLDFIDKKITEDRVESQSGEQQSG